MLSLLATTLVQKFNLKTQESPSQEISNNDQKRFYKVNSTEHKNISIKIEWREFDGIKFMLLALQFK